MLLPFGLKRKPYAYFVTLPRIKTVTFNIWGKICSKNDQLKEDILTTPDTSNDIFVTFTRFFPNFLVIRHLDQYISWSCQKRWKFRQQTEPKRTLERTFCQKNCKYLQCSVDSVEAEFSVKNSILFPKFFYEKKMF